MLFSEKLLNSLKPDTVILETDTPGTTDLMIRSAGYYELVMVGAGGHSTAIYSGDYATGHWTGHEAATGGCGALIKAVIFLNTGKYSVTVGCLGGGSDLSTQSYTGKTPGSSEGTLPLDTKIVTAKGDTLAVAGGGGYSTYGYRGNQKNDGACYTYNGAATGGVAALNVDSLEQLVQNGQAGAIGVANREGMAISRDATFNGYGKPNNVSTWYQEAYSVGYTVTAGTSGFFKLVYKKSNA